jgi:hypothetical protein
MMSEKNEEKAAESTQVDMRYVAGFSRQNFA